MTIFVSDDGIIELQGSCPNEEAEVLLQHLLARPDATVDWQACQWAHTAVVQVLLAARPKLRGPAPAGFLRDHVERYLTSATA
jgi:hypothetical protein